MTRASPAPSNRRAACPTSIRSALSNAHVTDSGTVTELFREHFARRPGREEMEALQREFVRQLTAAAEVTSIPQTAGAAEVLSQLADSQSWRAAVATGSWARAVEFRLSPAGWLRIERGIAGRTECSEGWQGLPHRTANRSAVSSEQTTTCPEVASAFWQAPDASHRQTACRRSCRPSCQTLSDTSVRGMTRVRVHVRTDRTL